MIIWTDLGSNCIQSTVYLTIRLISAHRNSPSPRYGYSAGWRFTQQTVPCTWRCTAGTSPTRPFPRLGSSFPGLWSSFQTVLNWLSTWLSYWGLSTLQPLAKMWVCASGDGDSISSQMLTTKHDNMLAIVTHNINWTPFIRLSYLKTWTSQSNRVSISLWRPLTQTN